MYQPRLCSLRWIAAPMLVVALLASNGVRADWFSAEQAIMGTRVHAEIWHDDPGHAEALLEQVLTEMRRVEAQFSPYIDGSELTRLNSKAASGWQETSAEMWQLLAAAARVSPSLGGSLRYHLRVRWSSVQLS